ncbi:uncharacterized protein LOC129342314 [Eublepharis macularius]|uniref:Placenta-expressed transcript 1 protein n=1 Tax=Eublepharis macularius TaxID=481883 RepID=A0AA97KFJ2_EUBMA|nr:uncharacterized protein LOC129342314 [Eublepharis macularius]
MTTSKCVLQLLFLGLLVSPAFLQEHPCEIVKKTVKHGSFHLDVSPPTYKPGEIYTVTIQGIDNSTFVILQATSSKNYSGGLWETENEGISCSGNEYVVQKNVSGNGTRTHWTSPNDVNESAAQIRVFVSFANGTTLLQSRTITRDLTTGGATPAPPTATHRATILSNTHTRLNSTEANHNGASPHHGTQKPYSSASTSQASSVLLAALQFLPVFLGFKLLS